MRSALQAVPGKGLGQQLAGIEHEVAAVRPVQGAAADQREVRGQRAEPLEVLDAPQQVVVRRVLLVHHRRRRRRGVVDEQIDLVAAEVAAGRGHRTRAFLGGRAEGAGIVDDVSPQRLDPGQDIGKVTEVRHQVVDGLPDGRHDVLAFQGSQPLAALAHPLRNLPQQPAEPLLERRDDLAEAVALGLRQLREGLRLHGLAILGRGEDEAARRTHEHDLPGRRVLGQCGQGLVLASGELRVDLLDPPAELLALEDARNHGAEFVHEPRHLVAQGPAPARRQGKGPGPRGVGEIVHVAPVARDGPPRRRRAEQLPDGRATAAAGRAEHERVVASVGHGHAEADGLDGPPLPRQLAEVGQFLGGREGKPGQRAGPPQA